MSPAPADPIESLQKTIRQSPGNAASRLELAELYARQGETYAAIQQMQIACDAGAKEEPVALRLAELYNALGETEEAEAVLSGAASALHAPPNVAMALSQTRLRMGDFRGAAEAVVPLIAHRETLPTATQQSIARALLLADEPERAAPLLPHDTTDSEWLALEGLRGRLTEQPRQAAQSLTRAVQQNPQDAWNQYLLGRARLQAGDTGRALAAWNTAAQLPDAPERVLTGAARLLAQQGRISEAVEWLRRVRGSSREDPDYWQAILAVEQAKKHPVAVQLARGYALFHSGDPWQAEAVWKAALPKAQEEDAKELYAAIHNSAFRRQDPETALRFATEAARRWPRAPYFLRRRAEVLLGQNRMQEAQTEAERLQGFAPPEQAAEVAELLSRIALDGGEPVLLKKNTDLERQLRPANPDPLLHLAEWQAQQGRTPENLERTLKLYQEALTVDPKNAEAAARAGVLLADLKRTKEAIAALLHALTLWPRVLDGAPHAQLATLYQREGQSQEAEFHAKRYRTLRQSKEAWPTLLKALRQDRPLAEWKALSEAALERRENWIALCAGARATHLAPQDAQVWRAMAAVQKRLGHFEEALDAVRRARRLEGAHKGTNTTTEAAR